MKQLVTLFCLAAAFAPAQDQRPTVRTGTAGVLIDVTVVDKDGRPVTDLKATDFELSEDGKPQQIISATLMQGGVPSRLDVSAAAKAAAGSAAAGTASPPAVRTAVPTVTAILFDTLAPNTRPFAARAAARFVSTLATTHEYAGVFLCGTSLLTLQPFTNRTSDLRAAVDRLTDIASLSGEAARTQGSTRTQGLDPATPVTAGAEYARGWTTIAEYEQRLYAADGGDPGEKLLTQMAWRMEQGYGRLIDEYEGDSSVSGLHAAIAALAPLPGRKSILYFAEELPVTSRLKSRFDAVIVEANRANITIYPVDAAGLRVHSQEDETARGVRLAGAQGVGDANRGDGAWTKDLENQEQQLSSRISAVLGRLASETGGFVIDNTNDLGKGVARMQVERATYYLLGYQPANTASDGKFRKVSVKVKRGKYTVKGRPGYAGEAR